VDVLYHALVALRALGVTLDDLRAIADERAGTGRRGPG
jgi:phosphoribosyl-ATP pyrophosphohydrolase